MKFDIDLFKESHYQQLDNVSHQSRIALGQAPFLIMAMLALAKPPNITDKSVSGLIKLIAHPSRHGDSLLHLCVAEYLAIDPYPGLRELLSTGRIFDLEKLTPDQRKHILSLHLPAEGEELLQTIADKAYPILINLVESARSEPLANQIINLHKATTQVRHNPRHARIFLSESFVTVGSLILRVHPLEKRFLRPRPSITKLVAEIAEDLTLQHLKKSFELSEPHYLAAVLRGVTA